MKKGDYYWLLLFALSAIPYFPLSQWVATAPVGTRWLVEMQLVYLIPSMFALLSLPLALVCLLFQKLRGNSLRYMLFSLLFLVCTFTGFVLGMNVRDAGMVAFTQRSKTLISAIRRYEQDHSSPPQLLESLVPDYLPEVPSTGMMGYPTYNYFFGHEAAKLYEENPWVLTVHTPMGMNFDQMLYFPRQNYPQNGYGGRLEPLEDWVYVHE